MASKRNSTERRTSEMKGAHAVKNGICFLVISRKEDGKKSEVSNDAIGKRERQSRFTRLRDSFVAVNPGENEDPPFSIYPMLRLNSPPPAR